MKFHSRASVARNLIFEIITRVPNANNRSTQTGKLPRTTKFRVRILSLPLLTISLRYCNNFIRNARADA